MWKLAKYATMRLAIQQLFLTFHTLPNTFQIDPRKKLSSILEGVEKIREVFKCRNGKERPEGKGSSFLSSIPSPLHRSLDPAIMLLE